MEELEIIASGPEHITMNGSLTVANAAAILKALREALAGTDRLTVTLGEKAEADVSFFQILCSAHRTATKLNKCLHLDAGSARRFYGDARASGYVRIKGCSRDRDGSCLWVKGDK